MRLAKEKRPISLPSPVMIILLDLLSMTGRSGKNETTLVCMRGTTETYFVGIYFFCRIF